MMLMNLLSASNLSIISAFNLKSPWPSRQTISADVNDGIASSREESFNNSQKSFIWNVQKEQNLTRRKTEVEDALGKTVKCFLKIGPRFTKNYYHVKIWEVEWIKRTVFHLNSILKLKDFCKQLLLRS